MTPRILNVILTHQAPAAVQANLDWWTNLDHAPEDLLVAYGGTRENYERLAHPNKCFTDDPRLRVKELQREKQSYSGVYRAITTWMRAPGRPAYTHLFFYEFDQLPLIPDLGARSLDALEREQADVLGHRVYRVDTSSHPHYLYESSNPDFHPFWEKITRRTTRPEVIVSMLGTGSFWRREAFEAVSDVDEPFRVYLEIWAPTVAHHLGYRVRAYPDRAAHQSVDFIPWMHTWIPEARKSGSWSIHPIKKLWTLPAEEIAAVAAPPARVAAVPVDGVLTGTR